MSEKTIEISGGGVGFLGLLAIVFITLKLCNVITWSWWWITAPLWFGPCALLGCIGVAILVFLFYLLIELVWKKK